eukprot:15353436-Ditylum_brightwellii.AAC.1
MKHNNNVDDKHTQTLPAKCPPYSQFQIKNPFVLGWFDQRGGKTPQTNQKGKNLQTLYVDCIKYKIAASTVGSTNFGSSKASKICQCHSRGWSEGQ